MRFVAFMLIALAANVGFAAETATINFTTNIQTPSLFNGVQETISTTSEVQDVIPERPLPTTWCEGYQQATNEQRVEERKDRDAGLRAGMQHSGYEINQYTAVCWDNFERDHAVAASTYCSTWPVDNVAFANEVEAAGTIAQACYVKQLAYSKRPSWYRFDLYVLEFLRGLFGSDDLAILG